MAFTCNIIKFVAVICMIFLVNWFVTSEVVAADKELVRQLGRKIPCKTPLYLPHNTKTPSMCGRFAMDKVISPADLEGLLKLAKKVFESKKSVGNAYFDINTGHYKDNAEMVNIFVKEHDLISEKDFDTYGKVIRTLRNIVLQTFQVPDVYLTVPTVFARLVNGEYSPSDKGLPYWIPHDDMGVINHYSYSGFLYLSTIKSNFTGGKLHFLMNENREQIEDTVEPVLGRVVIFSSSEENFHYTDKIAFGVQYSLQFHFTLDKAKSFQLFQDGISHKQFAASVKKRLLHHYKQPNQITRKYDNRLRKPQPSV